MKLNALRLHNVKRFAGRGVAVERIGDGVNVLCAVNEHGKSTSFDALHALFFQPHTSKAKAVARLRPYSGGNPLVEADIATPDGRFRLAKRFWGSQRASVTDLSSGRLVAQADEAEAFIAALVGHSIGGPAGLLWVRQEVLGLDNAEETKAREGVLSSVQGEVEAVTGGRRMASVLAACEEELLRLVTPTLKPKAGGSYALAVEEQGRLAERERQLGAEVAALREALDRRRTRQARLAELEDPQEDAALTEAANAAEKALAAARTHGEALRTAEAEAALACGRRDAARTALEAHRERKDRRQALIAQKAEADERRVSALGRKRAALDANEAAARAVEAAEREEREAADLLRRLERAMRAKDAATRIAALSVRLERAEAARKTVEDSEATLLDVPEKALADLERLEREIAGLIAGAEAGAPSLTVDYRPGAEGTISIDGEPFGQGGEIRLARPSRLLVEGIGSLMVRPPRMPGADKLRSAQEAHRKMLDALGVASLVEARARDQAAQAKRSEIALARQTLSVLAPEGIAALRAEITRLEGERAEAPEADGDPALARQVLDQAEGHVGTARLAAREAAPERERAEHALLEAERAFAGITAELASLDAALGDDPARGKTLAEAFEAAERFFAAADARAASLRAGAPDISNAEAALKRARSALEAARQEAGALREELADLNGRIRTRADDAVEEEWREAAEALGESSARVSRFEREIALLVRLREALNAARREAREHYFEPVMRELRPLMGLLFDDASVSFDDRTLAPHSFRRYGLDEPVEGLSGGMREQLAILTRLAFARLLAREGRAAPVILDDALVYSDDDRIEKMFDALHRQAEDQQIIVFSCRQRAFARLGGNRLSFSDWEPGEEAAR